jgi:hypothetical protein
MIYVKITCSCGQKYAFEVTPEDGRMPSAVHCPVCRREGTAAANEVIAAKLGIPKPSHDLIGPTDYWKQRALDAEDRADKAAIILREKMADSLKEVVVQELVSQRRELLNAHEAAAAEIAELIGRMDKAQAPLHERLRAYEAHIQQLEKELAARCEENRELLKLKIEMTKQLFETERTTNRLNFN